MPKLPLYPEIENLLLAAMPREECEWLFPSLELAHLAQCEILNNIGDPVQHAYFLTNGMVSCLFTAQSGASLQVRMIYNGGVVGTPIISRTSQLRAKMRSIK